MKVLVAIPSYNRPYDINKRCAFWLKKLENIDWKVFVRRSQYIYYAQVIPEENLVPIEVESYRETINAIGEYARLNGYELVHRIDDDMSFKKLGQSKRIDCHLVYQESYKEIVNKFVEDDNLFGVSISKPMFHIRTRDQLFARENKALYGNQWLRSEIMKLPEGVDLFDDIFATLEILKRGKKTLTYCGSYEDSVMYKNAGGLQSVDRNKLSISTIEAMQKHFPEVRQSVYKGNENLVDVNLKELKIK